MAAVGRVGARRSQHFTAILGVLYALGLSHWRVELAEGVFGGSGHQLAGCVAFGVVGAAALAGGTGSDNGIGRDLAVGGWLY